MKKLFTFLMLAAFVAMGFAQEKMSPIDHGHYFGNLSGIDRSNWYGSADCESGFRGTTAGDVYYLVIDTNAVPVGSTLERVYFIHYYNAQYCTNTQYTIHLYRNPTIATESPYALTPGEEIFSQPVSFQPGTADNGDVRVDFNTPYTVVEGEALCIGIEVGGTAYIGLGVANEELASHNYARFQVGSQYPDLALHYIFGDEDLPADEYEPMPYVLAVYYNDGEAYVNQFDLVPAILDPEEDDPVRITTMAVDPDGEAFYCSLGVTNNGIDMFKGDVLMDAYISCPGASEDVYFLQADTFLTEDSIQSGYIRYSQPFALFTFNGGSDPDYTSWAELEELGFSLPFEFCTKVSYNVQPGYECMEANSENNTVCITVTDLNVINITENTNMLNVSPNPASTYIKVENAAGSQIFVYNIAGQEVMSVESAEANETLNVSDLTAGLYIVRVVNGNEVSTAKVSIVR